MARKIKVKVKTSKSVSCTSGYSWIHASVSQVSGVQVAKVIDSQRLELPEVRVGKKKGSKVKCHRLLGDPYLRSRQEKYGKAKKKSGENTSREIMLLQTWFSDKVGYKQKLLLRFWM